MRSAASRLAGQCTAASTKSWAILGSTASAAFARHPAPTFAKMLLAVRKPGFIGVSEQKRGRRYHISGRVQGVGYRFFVFDAAQRHGVGGYTRNLLDGRVEVYAVGTDAQLQALLADLQRGPRLGLVEAVSESEAELLPQFAAHFSIERE